MANNKLTQAQRYAQNGAAITRNYWEYYGKHKAQIGTMYVYFDNEDWYVFLHGVGLVATTAPVTRQFTALQYKQVTYHTQEILNVNATALARHALKLGLNIGTIARQCWDAINNVTSYDGDDEPVTALLMHNGKRVATYDAYICA